MVAMIFASGRSAIDLSSATVAAAAAVADLQCLTDRPQLFDRRAQSRGQLESGVVG
jgi:hypothetical protein